MKQLECDRCGIVIRRCGANEGLASPMQVHDGSIPDAGRDVSIQIVSIHDPTLVLPGRESHGEFCNKCADEVYEKINVIFNEKKG